MASGVGIALNPGIVVGSITKVTEKGSEWPEDVEDVPIPTFDTGVFNTELINLNKLPTAPPDLTQRQEDALQTNPEMLCRQTRRCCCPKPGLTHLILWSKAHITVPRLH